MAYECCGAETRASTFKDILGALAQLLTLTVNDNDVQQQQTGGDPIGIANVETQANPIDSMAGHHHHHDHHSNRNNLNIVTTASAVLVTGVVLMASIWLFVVQRRRLSEEERRERSDR